MKKAIVVLALSALISAFACAGAGAATPGSGRSLSVPLTVTDRAGIARALEPVTSGVPVARELDLKATEGLRVLDGADREVPAQFEITSRWGGGPDDRSRPARWVLVDFQASTGSGGSTAYTLVSGRSGGGPAGTLSVTRNTTDALEISTGAARFAFNKRKFTLFDSVDVGSRRLVAPGGADIELVNADGARLYSKDVTPGEVVLETDGSVRKTFRWWLRGRSISCSAGYGTAGMT